jgi:drug/metabolite transporter (DMT)-like permease
LSELTNSKRGILFILASGSCWGFHGVLIKYAFALGGSFLQIFMLEVFFAAVFFGCFARSFFKKVKPVGLKQWGSLLAIGLATIGVGNFLFLSYSLGPVAIPATLMFLYLPIVYLVSILAGHQTLSPFKVGAISLVLLGAVLTTEILFTFREPGAIGSVLAATAAAMCYAVVFVLTPTVGAYTTAEFRSFTISAIGFLGCLVILAFVPSLWHDMGTSSVKFYVFALFLGVVGQILPVMALMRGLPLTGGSLGGMVASIELPIAVFSAALLLGESLHINKLLGVVLVLSGIVLYNYAENLSLRKARTISLIS